jgi:diacylglycerol O-acyltransferase
VQCFDELALQYEEKDMQRMNGFDAYFIYSDEINAVQHTLKIAILDPSTASGGWDFGRLRDMLRAMPNTMPFLTWKYLEVPFGLHHPVWVEDPEFNVDYHIRHIACPAPGDNRALCDVIAQVYASPLDHRRPLWMVWVIDGLENGGVAVVTLLHHSYTDGTGALSMMKGFYKPQPFQFSLEAAPRNSPPLPGKTRLLFDALCELPGTLIRTIPRVIHGLVTTRQLLKQEIAEGRTPSPNPLRDFRDSPYNEMLSACRSFAFEAFDLERIRHLSKVYKVTINDLFVACAAATNRRFMQEHGYNPDSGPLLTSIPFSQRPQDDSSEMTGNMVTTDYLEMPVHIADPLRRLEAAHHASNAMKEHYRKVQGADLNSVLDLLPAFGIRAINRLIARSHGKMGIAGNAALSNVAGPRETLYMGDFKLENWLSTGHCLNGLALNMTAWSYAGKFNLCILADKKVVPDPWQLMGYFSAALDEYERLDGQQREGSADGAASGVSAGSGWSPRSPAEDYA